MDETTVPRPTKIRVMGQPYTVQYFGPDTPLFDGDSDTRRVGFEALGVCDSVLGEMRIRSAPFGSSYAVERETVLHECMHAAMALSGLSEEPWIDGEGDHEESLVDRLTPILLDILRANPVLSRYLLAKEV